MSAVVDLVEDIVDGIDKYIIQPIKEDPLSFIATALAGVYLGPLAAAKFGVSAAAGVGIASGLANTAAGLVQGEDFDDALKGGALAGLGAYGASALSGVGNTPSSSTAALQKGIASTADDFGSAALQSTDDIFTQAAKSSADDYLNPGSSSYFKPTTGGTPYGSSAGFADDVLSLADDTLDPDAALALKKFNAKPDVSGAAGQAAPPPPPPPGYMAKPVDVGQGVYSGTDFLDDAAGVPGSQMPGGGLKPPSGYDLLDDAASSSRTGLKPSPTTVNQFGPQIEMLDDIATQPSMWDKALDYGKKGYDWAFDNPRYSVPLGLGALYLAQGDKDGPPDGGGGGNQGQIGDSRFYEPLDLYKMRRNQMGYEGDIYNYGTTGGEAQFFTPTVYEPIKYANGGQVAPQRDDYGYYTYGEIPQTMRNFAEGGLSALANQGGFDGRSDDIPAVLSDGEFVFDAETVALLGNGSSKAGANRLEEMRQSVRKQKGGALSKGNFSPDAKHPLAYLKSSKKGRG
jgi:hypothetical protein